MLNSIFKEDRRWTDHCFRWTQWWAWSSIEIETHVWPTRPGWHATTHLYLWNRESQSVIRKLSEINLTRNIHLSVCNRLFSYHWNIKWKLVNPFMWSWCEIYEFCLTVDEHLSKDKLVPLDAVCSSQNSTCLLRKSGWYSGNKLDFHPSSPGSTPTWVI